MIPKLFMEIVKVSVAMTPLLLVFMLCSAGIDRRYAAKWKCLVWLVIAIRMLVPVNFDLSFGHLNFAVSERFLQENPLGRLNHAIFEELSQGNALAAFLGIPAKTDMESAVQETESATGLVTDLPTKPATGLAADLSTDSTAEFTEKLPTKPTAGLAEEKTMSLPAWRLTPLDVVSFLWLCGVFLLFGGCIVGYLRFRRNILLKARPAGEGEIPEPAEELLARMCGRRRPRIFLSEEPVSPMVFGFVRPSLLLSATGYSREELAFILKHELIHYRRHDTCYKLLLVAAWSVHWFNPFAWLLVKRAGVDIELSCDAAVLENEPYAVRKEYTRMLLAALGRQCNQKIILTTQYVGGLKAMKKRLKHIIMPSQNKNGYILVAFMLLLMIVAETYMTRGTRVLAEEYQLVTGNENCLVQVDPKNTEVPGNTGEGADIPEVSGTKGNDPSDFVVAYLNEWVPGGPASHYGENPEKEALYAADPEGYEIPDWCAGLEDEMDAITAVALDFFEAWAMRDQERMYRHVLIRELTVFDDGMLSAMRSVENVTDAVLNVYPDLPSDRMRVVVVRKIPEDDFFFQAEIAMSKEEDGWKVHGYGYGKQG